MSRLRALLACTLFVLLPTLTAHSQTDTTNTGTTSTGTNNTDDPWFYLSNGGNTFGIPSGALGMDANSTTTVFPTTAVATAPTADDVSNLQGCGGVGQSDYTSALFNMPEVFDKFKRDVNSELAKQILTYNYSLPQTAALFDTLNSYGNARYQQFQTACKLDALKQDAKNQYMAACVKERYPERQTLVQQALTNASQTPADAASQPAAPANALTAPNPITATDQDQVNAQAYAQAWEICGLQYSNDSKAIALRKDQNTKFIATMRGTENVNVAIQPLICPAATTTTGATTTTTATPCWINLFVPQVRMCNGTDLSNGCTPTTDYGVKEPIVGITTYFDLLRFIMANGVVENLVESLDAEITKNNVDPATQKLAAGNTALNLARVKRPPTSTNDPTTQAFQQGYLSCSSSDIAYPLNRYREAINAITTGSTAENPANTGTNALTTNVTFATTDYRNLINPQLTLPTTMANEKEALIALTEVAVGCTANQTIPIFDPNITAGLSTQCNDDDWDAFYTMSSYDVSVAATRDIYRFIDLRLKQAYSRLLNEKGAGISQTTVDANGAATAATVPIDSPEIRDRLARAVKEVMLPSIETQIERLDEMEKSRGAFAERVHKIYSDKQGCVYSTPSNGSSGNSAN